MLGIKTRNVKEEDFLDIMNLATKCAPIPLERDSIYHNLTRHFANTCFVAEKEGKIVGYILGWISQVDNTVAYIHNICINPDFRRKKIGIDLYDRFIEVVRDKGCKKIFLIINPGNKASFNFHHVQGFKVSEEGEGIIIEGDRAVKDYNGPGKHMVVMYKEI